MEAQEQYLDYLIDVSFQGVNSFFVLQLEDDAIRTEDTIFFPQGEIKNYNFMANGCNFFNQS